MPMPFNYRTATQDFEAYLNDLRAISGLSTWNQCYTMTRSVFVVFRSHVTPQVALDFAQFLPAVLRAIFVEDWNLMPLVKPFGDRETLTAEVRSLREEHNFSTPGAIREVALAIKHAMNDDDHALMLQRLPSAAQSFWQVD